MTIDADVPQLLQRCDDEKGRIKGLHALVQGPQSIVFQKLAATQKQPQAAAIEVLVRAIEKVCRDNAVRADLASRIGSIRIEDGET